MSDEIDCRICEKRHHMNKCPKVRELDPISVYFCKTCGVHYTNGCTDLTHLQVLVKK